MPLVDHPRDVKQVGDFCWWPDPPYEDERVEAVLLIWLPNDYGARPLKVRTDGGSSNDPSPIWWWDGDREKPTLRESIYPHDGQNNPIWHGYLTAGELREC